MAQLATPFYRNYFTEPGGILVTPNFVNLSTSDGRTSFSNYFTIYYNSFRLYLIWNRKDYDMDLFCVCR